MASPRTLPYREVVRKLRAAGFEEISQKGSHVKFIKVLPEGILTAIVPKHREIPAGTLRSILVQARLSVKEFEEL